MRAIPFEGDLIVEHGEIYMIVRQDPKDPTKATEGPTFDTIREAKDFLLVTPPELRFPKPNPAPSPKWMRWAMLGAPVVLGVGVAGKRFLDRRKAAASGPQPIVKAPAHILFVTDVEQPHLRDAFVAVARTLNSNVSVAVAPVVAETAKVRHIDLTPAAARADGVDAVLFLPRACPAGMTTTYLGRELPGRVVNLYPPGHIPPPDAKERYNKLRSEGKDWWGLSPTRDPDAVPQAYAEQVLGDLMAPGPSSKLRIL